jgi:hypothetical protein
MAMGIVQAGTLWVVAFLNWGNALFVTFGTPQRAFPTARNRYFISSQRLMQCDGLCKH